MIGYARVSTRQHSTDGEEADLLAAGIRRDDLYPDQGVSGARASRLNFARALDALHHGDTLVVMILGRLGGSRQTTLAFAGERRALGPRLRMLNLGGRDVNIAGPMGSMLCTVMATPAQIELEIKRERITDAVSKRRAVGDHLGGRPQKVTGR